ncbi:glycosyltransferase [Paenibacillus camelliae]|uniref:glycosyltransferase n=1 Tax=Paenibacillus camelliae TaxID=512410 RepID=UPI002041A068|nr:glycosyltransferase [Paenibacillus camelliae]
MIIDIVLYQIYGRGGLETVLLHVSRGLKARGHRVRFMFHDPPIIESWMDQLDEVHICSSYNGDRKENDHRDVFAIRYRNAIEQLGYPDIILSTFRPIFSYIVRSAFIDMPKETHPPIISWIHGPPEAYQAPASHFVDADAHLAISYPVGQKIRAMSAYSPIFFVGNPIIPLPASDAQLIQRSKALKIIYVGQIDTAVKSIPTLLDACKQLQGDWSLELYGDGYERASFTAWCVMNGISDRVHWKGWQDNVWSHIKEASVLVLPSNSEGFGMVLTEALQRGIPVIASDTDGAKEVVMSDMNGWMFERGNSQQLSEVMQGIIDGKLELPSQEQCHRSVQVYDVDHVLDHFERVFDVMLNAKGKSGRGASDTAVLQADAAALASQGDTVVDSQNGLLEELLKQMNDQQWEKAVAVAERLYVQQPHSIYLASVLGDLHARLGHGNNAHFYWKQVMISTPDAVLSQVASKYVERVRG